MFKKLASIIALSSIALLSGCISDSISEEQIELTLEKSTPNLQGVLVINERQESYKIDVSDIEASIVATEIVFEVKGNFVATTEEHDVESSIQFFVHTNTFQDLTSNTIKIRNTKVQSIYLPNIHSLMEEDYRHALEVSLLNVLSVKMDNYTLIDYSDSRSALESRLDDNEVYKNSVQAKNGTLSIKHYSE